jgi:hypothetical protein
MVEVDPAGLVSAAQRIAAALTDVAGAGDDPLHPPLGADPASVGAATRLSVAGAVLAAALGEQIAALTATAEQLVNVGVGFAIKDEANAAGIAALSAAGGAPAVSGWAPPAPPLTPDVRPPLPPPPPVPGEAIARATHAGDPSAGEAFITGWGRVASAAEDAADALRVVADHLPWDSPVATPVVRAHLMGFADRLDSSAARARTLVDQAGQHSEQAVQARRDIPSPEEFDAVNQQWHVVAQANARSGGAFAIPLAQLTAKKADMQTQALQGYGAYHEKTDGTTAGSADAGPVSSPESAGQTASPAGQMASSPESVGQMASSPESAGQIASMLPQMIPTVLGAAGGLVGGVLSAIEKVPEALMQAGMQAASAATQGLSGLGAPKLDDKLRTDSGSDPAGGGGPGGVGGGGVGGGDTSPAAGGASASPPAVMPSTGSAPTPPTMPSGGLPEPVQASPAGGSATMPMGGMPLGGMMPGAGGDGGRGGPVRPKKVVVPPTPHTESVTGRVSADRIATSAASEPRDPEPPNDEHGPQPIVRRLTSARLKDEEP